MQKVIVSTVLMLLLCFPYPLLSQEAVIIGLVRDAVTGEPLPGVNVIKDAEGTVTNEAGRYELRTQPGEWIIEYRYIGYEIQTKKLSLRPSEARIVNIELRPVVTELDAVVITAGRFEQKLEQVTVSMAVVRPTLIENTNTTVMDDAMQQVPGVQVIDGQANIRGGSGFSYGAGSRVLILVDDLPMLAGDASDVKWSFLPTENLEQIEVIKGAASALYGSSAMNGVINIRTAYPKAIPETKVTIYNGIYDNPKNQNYKWWDGIRQYRGGSLFHSRKINRLDLITAGNYFRDEGYRMGENEERYRININTCYSFGKNLEGLSVGFNTNYMRTEGGLFFIWQDDSTGALIPQGGLDSNTTISNYVTRRWNMDPFVTYLSKNGITHKLRMRHFRTDNFNNTNQESFARVYYAEYQFQKRINENSAWTWGISEHYVDVKSQLYGDHLSNNIGFYTQLDQQIDRWNFSFGVRWEQHRVDTVKGEFTPVFRSGINYRLFSATHLRASYGQGLRFPSIAERFVKTQVGDVVIYPNDSLQPETGFTAEVGIHQGFSFSNWKGSLDIAGFWSEYKNMMEFTFGQWGNVLTDPLFGIGFKSLNIGNTRIQGMDFTLTGNGKIESIPLQVLAGYTLMHPIQTDFDPATDTLKNSAKYNILKYRYRRLLKADVETGYKNLTVGVSVRYNSFMENIDEVFNVLIPGVKNYRERNHKGDWVFDVRLFYAFLKYFDLGIIVKNLTNEEYVSRPADMQPPRSFVLQGRVKF
jgi:iron complex outermembrane receptor protein